MHGVFPGIKFSFLKPSEISFPCARIDLSEGRLPSFYSVEINKSVRLLSLKSTASAAIMLKPASTKQGGKTVPGTGDLVNLEQPIGKSAISLIRLEYHICLA